MKKPLALILIGDAISLMPSGRTGGILVERQDGHLAAIEDQGGLVYRDRAAYEVHHRDGGQDGIIEAREWGEWDGDEEWAKGLSVVLGSEAYWHSGGGIWLVFYHRPDGKFAVIGNESGGVYCSREQFEADEYGEKAQNFFFV